MKKKNGILISFFNSQNLGDVILANMLFDYYSEVLTLRKLNFGCNPIITNSGLKSGHEPLNRKQSIYVSVLNMLKKLKLFRIIRFIEQLRSDSRNMRHDYKKEWKELLDLIDSEVKDSDYLILGGGNMLFSDENETHQFIRLAELYTEISEKYNIDLYYESIGIGPFYRQEHTDKAVELLKKAKRVTFRDESSLSLYAKHSGSTNNYYLSADPALLLRKEVSKNCENDYIAINFVGDHLIAEDEKKKRYIINCYNRILKEALKINNVILFSTDSSDIRLLEELKCVDSDRINVKKIEKYQDIIDLYNRTNLLILSRMHTQIIAYTQGKPFIAIAYQQKVRDFATNCGNSENVYDLWALESYIIEIADKLKRGISVIFKEKEDYIRRLEYCRNLYME